jgi:hypothetical protein
MSTRGAAFTGRRGLLGSSRLNLRIWTFFRLAILVRGEGLSCFIPVTAQTPNEPGIRIGRLRVTVILYFRTGRFTAEQLNVSRKRHIVGFDKRSGRRSLDNFPHYLLRSKTPVAIIAQRSFRSGRNEQDSVVSGDEPRLVRVALFVSIWALIGAGAALAGASVVIG